jgi:conjugal transfer ATP-binding protein TraC
MADEGRAAELSRVLAFDEESKLFLLDDQHLGFAFLTWPLSGGDEQTEKALRSMIETEWPVETTMQWLLVASPNVLPILKAIRAIRPETIADVLRSGTEERIRYLAAKTDEAFTEVPDAFLRDFQLFVTVKIPIKGAQPTPEELKRARDKRGEVEKGLENVKVNPLAVDHHTFVSFMCMLLNRSEDSSWRATGDVFASGDQLLNEQVFDFCSGVAVDRGGVNLGDTRLTLLSVKSYPESIYFGKMAHLVGDLFRGDRGLRGPFFLNVNVHFPNATSKRAKLSQKRNWVANQAFGPLAKWVPRIVQRKNDFDVLFKSLENGARPIQMTMTVGLFSADMDTARRDAENARNYLAEQSFTFVPDRFVCRPLFVNVLPFGADVKAMSYLGRYRTFTTEHAARLLPVFSDWKGTGTPVVSFVSRQGQLMSFDLFDSPDNYNAVIAAKSGSGKSFLANELIESYLSVGAQLWVIDIGGSYRKLAKCYGGDYIDFETGSPIGLNPFPLVDDLAEYQAVLEGLIATMAAPTEKLTDLQNSHVSRVIQEVFAEKGRDSKIDDIAERLRANEDRRVQDVGDQLYPFTSQGAFGFLFNRENNVTFNRDFTVLELERLRGRPHLQKVVLAQLIFQIESNIYHADKRRPKIVIIDEGWQLIADGGESKFIEHAFRRFRKYRGSIVLITQSPNDLYEADVGRAIMENASNVLVLAQKSESIDALERDKRFDINPYTKELLKSVHTVPNAYSEIFVRTGRGEGIARLIVDRYHRLLFSTTPSDVAAVDAHLARGCSMAVAVRSVLEERARMSAA